MGLKSLTPAERKALYKIFADYRSYKEAIANQRVPTSRGFASAIHPDQIHASRVYPPGPRGISGISVTSSFSDIAYRRYVWRIDWHVKGLSLYRRSILRKRFLCRGPLPTDAEVHAELRKEGWYVSKRYFDAEKREGIEELFRSLKASNDAENDQKSVRKSVRKNNPISSTSRTKL